MVIFSNFSGKIICKETMRVFLYMYPPRSCKNTWNHLGMVLRKRWYQI